MVQRIITLFSNLLFSVSVLFLTFATSMLCVHWLHKYFMVRRKKYYPIYLVDMFKKWYTFKLCN